MPFLNGMYGNPSSAHEEGRRARQAIEKARAEIAKCVDAEPDQVFFTSSATTANNIALEMTGWLSGQIMVSPLEHPSVMNTAVANYYAKELPLDRYGRVSVEGFSESLTPEWLMSCSVCWVSSETGIKNPISDLAKIADSHFLYFHTDATQAIGRVSIKELEWKPDFLTFSAHKIGGPRGVGVFVAYNNKVIDIRAESCKKQLIYGGNQEKGIWPGTENTAAIVGSAAALKAATENMEECNNKTLSLRSQLINRLAEIKGLKFNTPPSPGYSVPGIVNVSVPWMDGTKIVMEMDEAGVAISSGSACSTGSGEPSHAIMTASGGDENRARGTVRFSFNETNEPDEIAYAMDQFAAIVKKGRNES